MGPVVQTDKDTQCGKCLRPIERRTMGWFHVDSGSWWCNPTGAEHITFATPARDGESDLQRRLQAALRG